jgi:tetratricopeptide (TPR) repeat protein
MERSGLHLLYTYKIMRVLLLRLAFLPWVSLTAFGQTAAPATSTLTAAPASKTGAPAVDYSGEPIVIEHLDSVYEFAADGTGSKTTSIVARIQSEAALKELGVLNLPFTANTQHPELIYVRVRHADGSVVETPVSQAIEMPSPVTREAPFYSDLKLLQLPIRSFKVGDTLEWKAKVTFTKPEAAGQFWGSENLSAEGVILSQTLELRVPKDTYLNVWSPTNKPGENVEGDERVFRWTSSQLKPTVGKEADAEKEQKKKKILTPAEELDETEGKLPTVAWTTFKSWEAVGTWYRGLEGDRILPDADVKAKVAELVVGKKTEEEKVRAVYAYVGTQIRYIGVAFGIGRYQPHQASDVLQNQYGDCKDKHTLLSAMLSALGLHPEAVLIGAGVRFNEAVPSPGSFNHLITQVSVDGQPVWLDSTAEVAPYRALMYVLRDKNALVIPDTGVAKIERTPPTLPSPAVQTMDAVGALDKEGTSNSRMTLTLRDDDEITARAAFRQTSPAQYDQLVQRISQNMGYGGTTSHAEVSAPDKTDDPMIITYDYKREKAGDWDNLRIVPQLTPVSLPRLDDKEPPVQTVMLGVPRVEKSTSAMKLPEGWTVVLPEAVHKKSAYVTYDETYRFEKGTLYAERRIEVLKQKVPISDWKTYKKWADDVDLGNETYVQLVRHDQMKIEGGKAISESDTVKESSGSAQELVAAANEDLRHQKLDEAKTLLDKAKSINAEQEWLWTTYGFYELGKGEMTQAADDFRKELSLHVERYETYAALANLLTIQGKRADAEETLHQWEIAEETNPMPSVRLAGMQLEDGDAAAAVKTAEAAVQRLPQGKKKNDMLQIVLGQAQLKTQMKDKGVATLVAVMQTTEDPGMMNNAAYELADAGEALPLTEKTTREALTKLGTESQTWTLDEDPQMLNAKSALIVATWDTMGWILYREGKFEEAESYLKAAWRNNQSATVGGHLAEVALARGNKEAALVDFELAIATIPQHDMLGKKKALGADGIKLQAKADALRKAGAKSVTLDKQRKLLELRTVPMGEAKDMNGVAEYRLLLSGGKITRVEKIGTKEILGGEDRLKKTPLSDFWPPAYPANLVRYGMLNCHSKVCELVFEP